MGRDREPGVPLWLFVVVVALVLGLALLAGLQHQPRADEDGARAPMVSTVT